jgi:glycosyltransferase involved in cell wall biosynthesis
VRIVHVTPLYAPVVGGVEEVVKRVAEFSAMHGYDVYVVTYNRLRQGGAGSLPRYENINGVHVVRLRPDFTLSHGSYSSELPIVLRELRPDIVHVHVWRHPHVFQVAKLRKIMKFKAVLHGHAPFHLIHQIGFTLWLYHRLGDLTLKRYLDLYDIYIALTPHERDIVAQRLKLPSDKVVIIPNGINPPKNNYHVSENDRWNKILFLGRMSREKNLLLLIKSMEYIVKAIKDAKLILVGPDEGLMKKVYGYAKSRGLTRAIKYLGPIYGDEKFRIYAGSAVFALPSLYEAFGITLLEAGIVGTPSVITGQGGQIYTAPPGIASILAKPNPKDYSEAITTILSDKKLWEKLSQGAREWAQQFAWNKILPKYEKQYKQLAI